MKNYLLFLIQNNNCNKNNNKFKIYNFKYNYLLKINEMSNNIDKTK